MNRRHLLAALTVAVSAEWLHRGVAHAAPAKAPSIEISVIYATRTDGGGSIDPQLGELPQLRSQQPFVRYNVFKLLDRTRLPTEKGRAILYQIADGRTLQVTLVDVTDADKKSEERYHVRVEIAGPKKKEFLKLLEVTAGAGAPFFVGGQTFRDGTLFLELVVRAL
jgi:hypothetical protein